VIHLYLEKILVFFARSVQAAPASVATLDIRSAVPVQPRE
jgi:hypothetical protein